MKKEREIGRKKPLAKSRGAGSIQDRNDVAVLNLDRMKKVAPVRRRGGKKIDDVEKEENLKRGES